MVGKWTHLVAAAAVLSVATPALAAPVSAPVAPEGRALLLRPLTLTKVDDLSFGTVIPSSNPGTVSIDAVTGNRTSSPEVTLVASDPGNRAYFAGAGTPGQQVIMAMTPPASLSDGLGNTITVQSLNFDGGTTRTIAADMTFYVGVGGTLVIGADQPEGTYSATFDVTADYQ